MPELGIMLIILGGAWFVDQVFGEYPARIHPVVWMGRSVNAIRRLKPQTPTSQFLLGLLLATCLPAMFAAISFAALEWTKDWVIIHIIIGIFLLKASFALKVFGDAAFQVTKLIETGAIDQARKSLSALCSRDPAQLDEEELINSSIASVAENLCDSVIAPLFYFYLFGIPGAIAYRMVNTLDAMIGYRDERRYLGAASARFDDVLNWFPARLSSFLLLLSALIVRQPVANAWSITWRDHDKTPSPNGGWTMAAMAGILGLQINKPGIYSLGDPLRAANQDSLQEAWNLARLSSLIFSIVIIGFITFRS